jgi:hypothetical protein
MAWLVDDHSQCVILMLGGCCGALFLCGVVERRSPVPANLLDLALETIARRWTVSGQHWPDAHSVQPFGSILLAPVAAEHRRTQRRGDPCRRRFFRSVCAPAKRLPGDERRWGCDLPHLVAPCLKGHPDQVGRAAAEAQVLRQDAVRSPAHCVRRRRVVRSNLTTRIC